MKLLHKTIGSLLALCLLLIFVFLSICCFAYNLRFYEKEYVKNNIYETVRMEKLELKKVTQHMIDYLKGKNRELNIETTVNGEGRLFFSEREIYHMHDVLLLFNLGRTVTIISIVISIACIIILIAAKADIKRTVAKSAAFIFSGFIAVCLLLALVAAIDFDGAFTTFHELFFNNDLWLLDPRYDLLINILPIEFFIDISIRICAMLSAILILLDSFVIAICMRHKNRRDIKESL